MKNFIMILVTLVFTSVLNLNAQGYNWTIDKEGTYVNMHTDATGEYIYVFNVYGGHKRNESSWVSFANPPSSYHLRDIFFVNANTGYLYSVYAGPNGNPSNFQKTTNGGASWQVQYGSSYPILVSFDLIATPTALYLGGGGGGIKKSEDDGMSWQLDLSTSGTVVSFLSTGINEAYASLYKNDSVFLLKKDTNWNSVATILPMTSFAGINQFSYHNLAEGDDGAVYFTGYNKIIRYKDNQFSTTTLGQEMINHVVFEGSIGFCASIKPDTSTTLYRTMDRGVSWQMIHNFTDGTIEGLAVRNKEVFVNIWRGWFHPVSPSVVYKGSVLTGVSNNTIPTSFALQQNYPNPFNPTTNINFSVPKATKVTIKVFNLVGQQISTLVDELMTTGEHSIVFNGSNLSSGVYLYTFTANGKTSTRKMTLVK